MRLWKCRDFAPSLIDLVKYEKELLYSKRHGQTLMPPPSVPGLSSMGRKTRWTDSEMQAMRDNRVEAKRIYNEIVKLSWREEDQNAKSK